MNVTKRNFKCILRVLKKCFDTDSWLENIDRGITEPELRSFCKSWAVIDPEKIPTTQWGICLYNRKEEGNDNWNLYYYRPKEGDCERFILNRILFSDPKEYLTTASTVHEQYLESNGIILRRHDDSIYSPLFKVGDKVKVGRPWLDPKTLRGELRLDKTYEISGVSPSTKNISLKECGLVYNSKCFSFSESNRAPVVVELPKKIIKDPEVVVKSEALDLSSSNEFTVNNNLKILL